MEIIDRVYGRQEIRETVLIELVRSRPLARLKGINQAGVSKYLNLRKDVTRFEHSVGVMLLLRKFQASIVEQIAGLLHDVPHTAFSHVADFVHINEHHEFHELFHEQVIVASEIPQILKKHGIPELVIHPEKFSLLEQKIPDLCADRIDYALRDFMAEREDHESIQAKLSGLVVYQGQFMFKDQVSAEAFARDYLELDRTSWSDPKEIAAYLLFAQAVRHALDRQILTNADLFTDDQTVWNKLKAAGDAFVHKKLAFLTPSFRIEPASPKHYHLYVKSKIRYVDPLVLVNNSPQRLSEIAPKFKHQLAQHRKSAAQGVYVFVYPE